MWNNNVELSVDLFSPKIGICFKDGSEYLNELKEAIKQVNEDWNGDRQFEILDYIGTSVKMAYRSTNPIKNIGSVKRYLQNISIILAHDMQWNKKATLKEGRIFTIKSYSVI